MKRKQSSILNMLKKKKPNHEVNNNSIEITPYLCHSNNLNQETNYTVSIMAKIYFRDHSNINEILDRYLEREKITNVNKDNYLASIIRFVISYQRMRRDYPFNMFKFESDYHESVGKYLLRHYEIKSNEDLQKANVFLVQNNIMHCQVSLNINNKFRNDEQEYINRKQKKVGFQNLKPFLRIGTDHALRIYNQEHNLFKKYHIDDISFEEMCEISTIERMTRRNMAKEEIDESEFDNCVQSVFKAFKVNRGLAITSEGFYIFPQYLLIINNLTPEQELIVTERMDRFYAYTNAKDLLAINKKNIHLSNESADPVINRKERRKLFYLKYIRLVDKKQPPFNNLLWIKNEEAPNDNHLESEPGVSNSNVWKKKTVIEKNDTAQPHQKDDAVKTNYRNEIENANKEHRLARNPKDYLSAQISGSKYAEIIFFLMNDPVVVEELKKEIVQDSICSKMWVKNSRVILWNCIHFNLEDKNEHFLDLIKSSSKSREQLNEMLKKFNIDINIMQSIGEPIASSTQTMDIPFDLESLRDDHQNRPFQSCASSDDILDINKKSQEREIKNNIKQEKNSEIVSYNINDSDVQPVSPNATEVVSISDEESIILDNNQIVPENNGIDVYQQNLNIDSQVNHDSNDINASLVAEYNLRGHRDAIEKVTKRRHPRNQLNKPSRMLYESDATSPNNNAHN
ncbi:uncharacterized protein [Chironomus tepperi]|uniref:uncharacterized protein n=1 Tax=Chironomus tepperi TaxID=113505 RepID=UPI00391F7CC3